MKKLILPVFTLIFTATTFVSCGALSSAAKSRALQAGMTYVQGVSITDAQVAQLCAQYVAQSDAQANVALATDPYAQRLARLTKNITTVGQYPANIKVYLTKDINAFASGDGSVRVYSGLMDVMDDAELMAVIGHEIGHVVNADSKNAMKAAYKRAAALQAVGVVSETAGSLADGMLGKVFDAYLGAQYSQKQEFAADDYGYNFAIAHGYAKTSMASSLKKLLELEGTKTARGSYVQSLFSDHPTTEARIQRLEQKK